MDCGRLRLGSSMSPHPEQHKTSSQTPYQLDVHQYYVGPCLISRAGRRSNHQARFTVCSTNSNTKDAFIQQRSRRERVSARTYSSCVSAAWAGAPLVSLHPNLMIYRSHFISRAGSCDKSGFSGVSCVKDLNEVLPISRLALHAHGPPLILQGGDSSSAKSKRGTDLLQYSVTPVDHPVQAITGEEESLSTSSCSESDDKPDGYSFLATQSIASSSEELTPSSCSPPIRSSLPRIIKPRRRRKKDRSSTCHDLSVLPCSSTASGVALKSNRSLCHGASTCKSPPLEDEEIDTCSYSYYRSEQLAGVCKKNASLGEQPICDNHEPDYGKDCGHDSVCAVSARIVTTPTGIRDLEIKFHGHRKNDISSMLPPLLPVYQFDAPEPPQRPWIQLALPAKRKATCIFTVMCYNVLCDKYATRQLYGYCPSWALSWEYRRKSIMEEIRQYAADIISLQEVETDQFYNFFLPELQRDGYDGIFSPKSRAKTMTESDKKHVDGCAIFFRTSKFSLVKEHLVEFNQLAMANAEGSDDMLNRVMTKDNIGLAALLETKEGAFDPGVLSDPSLAHQPLLVCTAHIHWDPEYCDVKLIQTMMLMHELRYIVEDAIHLFQPNAPTTDTSCIPLLLCGDLNSLPYSGVIEFLSTGRIAADHSDFKELGYKDCLRKLSSPEKPNEYTHPFRIARAYGDDIMRYTNYTYDFKGVIDYVFYSKLHMNVLGVLGPLDSEWMKANKVAGCPHPHIPSDHFPLVVELEMSPVLPPANNGLSLRR